MSLPDYRALKKLADACRKAGIKQFKNAEYEFTLTDDAPLSSYKRRKKYATEQPDEIRSEIRADEFQSERLSDEQLLFYSVANSDVTDGEQN